MASEIELKMDLTPEAAEALLSSGLLPAEPVMSELRAIYFDTPEDELHAAGFSLRIRRTGDQRIQTVKAAGESAASLFVRPEWEQLVESDVPVLDDTTPLKALLGERARALRPVFEVAVTRMTWLVSWQEAQIELVLDRGEIVAGDRRTPVCEIELELKSGDPAALFSYARGVAAEAPLRPGVLSKAERGYRLLGPAFSSAPAEPVLLSQDMDVERAFRVVAGACLRQFRLNEMLFGRGDVEVVHQARVALRRLRSALAAFAPVVADDALGHLKDELRWLAGVLGAVRDLDVLIPEQRDAAARAALEQARREAFERATDALASPRAQALMLDLSEWLACGDWHHRPSLAEMRAMPLRDFAIAALDRLRRKVKRQGRDLADLDDGARHRVRKDAKKLRYAAEFFASLFQGRKQRRRYGDFIEALKTLQDALGVLNDRANTSRHLAEAGLFREEMPQKKGADEAEILKVAVEAHDAFCDARRFWR